MATNDGDPKKTFCTRLEPRLVEELPGHGEAGEGNTSAALRQVVREWVATKNSSSLEFRETALGRVAAVRDGPTVEAVRDVFRAHGEDVRRLPRHFGEGLSNGVWGEAVGYLVERAVDSRLDRLEERRQDKRRKLELAAGWSVDPTRLLFDWRVPARAVKHVAPEIDAEHIGKSSEPVGKFDEVLDRAREKQRVLLTTRYAEVGARMGAVSGDVALLEPGHDLSRHRPIAEAIQVWAMSPEEGEWAGPWVPPLEE